MNPLRAGRHRAPAPVPLRVRLLRLALSAILPLALSAGLGLVLILRNQREDVAAGTMDVARLSAAAVNMEIDRSILLLQALAASPLLDHGDVIAYHDLARRILASMPAWRAVILADTQGNTLMHTEHPAGAVRSSVVDAESLRQVISSRGPTVGPLQQGPQGSGAVPVRVPVLRGDRVVYVLSAVLRPESIRDVIAAQRLPPGWVMTVLDAQGVRLARSRAHELSVGKPGSPSLAALIRRGSEGRGVTRTTEGTEVYTAFVRLHYDWTVAVGIPTTWVRSDARRAFALFGGGLALSLLLGAAAALWAARRISDPMAELRDAARQIGEGAVPSPPRSDILEVQQVGAALVASALARKRSEAERDAAMDRLRRAQEQLTQQVADLERLQALGRELLQLPNLGEQLHALLQALCAFHGAELGLVWLRGRLSGRMAVEAATGFSQLALDDLAELRDAVQAYGLACEEPRRVIADTESDPRFAALAGFARSSGFRAVHGTCLRGSSGDTMGMVAVHLPEPREPTERECRLADLCAGLAVTFVERAHAEALARESERRLQIALDSSTVPFAILAPVRDAQGLITDFSWDYLNRAAAEALERRADQLVGRRILEVMPQAREQHQLFGACVAVAELHEARQLEVHWSTAGADRWTHVVATPFHNRVAAWFADITERKKQEQALQEADRRKDEFLATLAHELRNPLAPIRQAAMISGAAGASDAQKRWSQEVIERQVQHMALLLDDLLDVSRITRGKLELRKTRTELRAAIDAALETARPLLDARRHRLVVKLPPQPVWLEADPLRFAQIVSNLLGNAAKYTDAGGRIELSARCEQNRVIVEVADNGIGLDAADLDAIFEMFSQVKPGDDRASGGLGIGLALARGLAQLHGGTLTASSEGRGRGSRFTLTLPLGAAAQHGRADCDPPPGARGAPLRILVADDNRDAAQSLAELLRLQGHEVHLAFDGEQALALFREQRPDAALLDIGMPHRDGHEVAQAIRAQAGATRPTLIAITGWGQERDKEQAREAGFDHHLTKPIDPRRLLAILARVRTSA